MLANSRRNWVLVALAAVMAFALVFAAVPARADSHTFDVSVYHGINGRSLGLSKELPVNVIIWKDGEVLGYINDLTFKERINASLPEGEYTIQVYSQELGAVVDSMTIGPVEIPAGANLVIRAKLGAGKAPVLMVKAK